MKAFLILLLFIATGAGAETVRFDSESTIIRPFGMWEHRQPPPRSSTVVIASPKVEFSAQQVCGYTDWSTAAIELPKEILTAEYWGDTMRGLKDQAIDALLGISGALPSMLACNASPTFCHVMNQAKSLAQAELSFTMDSCTMLDGLANTEGLQNEALRACIQKKMAENSKLSASKAREACITGGSLEASKTQKAGNVAADLPAELYSTALLIDEACAETKSSRYLYSHHAYTVSKTSCTWLKELFPGVSVEAKAMVKTGGTFQPVAEKKYTEEVRRTNDFLIGLLSLMHKIRYGLGPYRSDGPKPRHTVLAHRDVQRELGRKADGSLKGLCTEGSGDNCKVDPSLIPPAYRLSSGGTKPTLLIDPAMIFELVPLVGPDSTAEREFEKKPSQLELLLTRISQATAYIKTNDVLSDALGRTIAACKTSGLLQGASAQVDCNSKIALLQAEKEALETRRATDNNFLAAQLQFYQEVDRALARQMRLTRKDGPAISRDDPEMPSNVR